MLCNKDVHDTILYPEYYEMITTWFLFVVLLGFEQVLHLCSRWDNLFIALEAYLVIAKNTDAVTTQFSAQVTHQAEKQSKLPQL